MDKRKVSLDTFEEFVLPGLQEKHTDVASLQKAINDGFEIDNDGKSVSYRVSAKKSDGNVISEPGPDVAGMVKAEVASALKAQKAEVAQPLPAVVKSEKYTIPAEIKRVGTLKYFKNAKINGLDADERAFRYGMWALAARGLDFAKDYCRDHGIGITKLATDNIVTKLQSANINTTGGFLVPEEFSSDLIELKEQYGVARRLFAKEVMSSDTLLIPRRTGGLTASFVGEGQAGTESTTAWDQVRLTAKDLMVLTRLTNQLNADSLINWADRLAYECSYANTLKEDQCAFLGAGAQTHGGINGVSNRLSDQWSTGTAGVGYGLVKQATGTTLGAIVLADFHNVVGSLPQYADTPNTVWVCHRAFYFSVMQKLELASGGVPAQEIRTGNRAPRPLFLGYPVEFSQVLPSVTASATVFGYLGDFNLAATFGDRQMDSISFSDQASVGSQSMWERNEMGVRCVERFDINVHDVGDGTTVGPVVGIITG